MIYGLVLFVRLLLNLRKSDYHGSYHSVGNYCSISDLFAAWIFLPSRRRNNSHLDCRGCYYHHHQPTLDFPSLVLGVEPSASVSSSEFQATFLYKSHSKLE